MAEVSCPVRRIRQKGIPDMGCSFVFKGIVIRKRLKYAVFS